ncbi:MAG TPA: type II secretion system protein [Verrucomicrobiales bacterium]|nr:type II secretion system protein [Verrucomicrobiales bacterium]
MHLPRPAARSAGFTLIEIVVTLFIVLIILGTAVFSIDTVMKESRLQKESTAIKLAARKSLRTALAERRSFTITFRPTYFTVAPTYPDRVPEEVLAAQRRRGSRGRQVEEVLPPGGVRHDFEEGMVLQVRRWGEMNWRLPGELGDRWVFEPSGICEPISVRLNHETSYVELTFNPLTAAVALEDEVRYVK